MQNFFNFAELPSQEAGGNQFSARLEPGTNLRCFTYQHIMGQIGANNIVGFDIPALEFAQIFFLRPQAMPRPVLYRVLLPPNTITGEYDRQP